MIKVRPGDIFFIMHNDNKLSRLFAWFMGSSWSHCGLVYEVTKNRIYTIETTDFEVTHRQLNDYINDHRVNMEIWTPKKSSKEERKNIVFSANGYREKPYGYLQLLGHGIRRVLMRIGITINNPIRFGTICCDVVLLGYAVSKYKELHVKIKTIDTQDVYERVKNGSFDLVYKKEAGK